MTLYLSYFISSAFDEITNLLFQCGIDVNKPNSYDQTALDIVNKFTTTRAAKELKHVLKGKNTLYWYI